MTTTRWIATALMAGALGCDAMSPAPVTLTPEPSVATPAAAPVPPGTPAVGAAPAFTNFESPALAPPIAPAPIAPPAVVTPVVTPLQPGSIVPAPDVRPRRPARVVEQEEGSCHHGEGAPTL